MTMRLWIVLVVGAVHLVSCNEENSIDDTIPIVYEPTWVYECNPSSGCVRTEQRPTSRYSATMFSSLDVCRTVCGQFGGLWPRPVSAALTRHTVQIHPNYLRFDLVDVPATARELVDAMAQLVGPNLRAECDGNVTEVVETPVVVYVSVKSEVLKLDWNTDEEYMLDVQFIGDGVKVKITAETVYGARHALETFTQLVAADRPDYSDQSYCSLRLVAGAKIRDSPAFKHRGFVLDTSRHFIPLKDIRRTIDGMAATKLNVFHWHVTDSQSFPLESSRVPQFTKRTIDGMTATILNVFHWDVTDCLSFPLESSRVPQFTDNVSSLPMLAFLYACDRPDYSDQTYCSLRLVAGAKMRDRPVFKHGALFFWHFIPFEDIRRTIDGMTATILNVLHWDVTDCLSFPLESSRVPLFTKYGAYSPHEIYTTEEVRELVKYAQVRGVRMVIEIDSPAHAGNGWQWGREYGLGDLAVCVNEPDWRKYCIQPPCGQLNPANPAVYPVLKNLYRDIVELLPEPALLHVGGDEVFFDCWRSSAEILNYMDKKGFNKTDKEGYIQLWAEFHKKSLQLWDGEVVELGGTQQPVMIWSSELTKAHRIQKYLSTERYIVEVWEPSSNDLLTELLALGYRTVSVPKDIWYLDRGFWGSTSYSNWRRMYSYTLPHGEGMLGGEVAMWTEYVDEQGLDTRVWPRAAAVAERLWSNPSSDASLAERRLQRFRDRIVKRGLRPDVLSPGWCSQHESKCL